MLRRQTAGLGASAVGEEVAAFGVLGENEMRHEINDQPQKAFALAQRLLGPIALGDVAHKSAENKPSAQPDGRDRQFDRKFLPIAAHCRDLDPLAQHRPFLCCQEVFQAALVRLAVTGRYDGIGQTLADHLRPDPAEDSLRLPGPTCDPPLFVNRDNCIQS